MDDFRDMPPLVDSQRPDGSAPMMMQMPVNPFPAFDAWNGGGAPPQQFHPSPGQATFLGPLPWPAQSGFDSQSGTPMSWGSSSSMSTPMLGGPAAFGIMPPTLGVSSEGWPRPLASRTPELDNSPPWKDRDADDMYERDRRLVVRSNNTSLSRSVSLSSSPSSALSSRSISRKASLRGANAAEALKRPPREWRTDFSLSGIGLLSGLLGSRGRSRSFGYMGGVPDPKVVLHAYIRYNSSKPPMCLDLRMNPTTIKFRALSPKPLNDWDLMMRFVCEPPLPSMRLYHTHYPWYIEVEAQNPSGVTLYDLFAALHYSMMTPIQNADYYNVEMSDDARDHVAEAWATRCKSEQERSQGIRRVDYLMGRVVMEGIQKGKDGMWEIKTRKASPP